MSNFLCVLWHYKTNELCLPVRPSVLLSVDTLGTTLYGQDLVYPSCDFIFLLHMERTYIEAVRMRIIRVGVFQKL